ncbi:MAG: hypothetical protein JWR69_4741 [Pedosphaera sp.]|nr:hypothetical protein [Pedosphaera sp.]
MMRRLDIHLAAAFALCVILLAGCDRASTSSDSKTKWIDPNKLEAGPIRRANLAEDQISRVQSVQKVFSEVDPSPIEKWMEDFKRDANPERELAIWEGMASAFAAYTASNSLTLGGKKEVFQVVLLRSGASDDEVLKHLDLKILTARDAREIMALFATKPEPIRVVSP